ncbi:MAG: C40 family peptidase [Desulfovibrionaceae bacterium]|nr:C40 family peptidase [Desulfovibrionaceae bacterium]MBF0513104.1 C40 family peptidase [Desulfovibrionaceae bacterium]
MSYDVAGMLQYMRERQVNALSGQAQSAPRAAPGADFSGALDAAHDKAVLSALMPDPNAPAFNERRFAFDPSRIRLPVDKSLRHPDAPPDEATPRAAAIANAAETAACREMQDEAALPGQPSAMTAAEESRLATQAQNDLAAIARHNAKLPIAGKSRAGLPEPERIKDLDPLQSQNQPPAERLLGAAQSLLGKPYRSGGESPRAGFDCSGFTSYVYGKMGLELPRNSRQQFAEGREIAPSELKKGDLVFFGSKKHISHVGIYAGDGKFIHSGSESGHVKISDLSDPYWKNRLAGCRRLL